MMNQKKLKKVILGNIDTFFDQQFSVGDLFLISFVDVDPKLVYRSAETKGYKIEYKNANTIEYKIYGDCCYEIIEAVR